MAPLPCRAEAMGNRHDTHANLPRPIDRHQRIRRAGRNAREIFAEVTGDLVGKDDGRSILLMKNDGAMRADFYAIAAFRAAFEEHLLLDGAGGPQPILAHDRYRLLRNHFFMFAEFVGGFCNGKNGVFEKIPPAVFRIGSH